MIAEVLAFAMVMAVFEFVVLCMVPPRARLRLLGSDISKLICHFGFLLLNLIVHWGTVTGTMSATLAFIVSLVTVYCAEKLFGSIKDGRYYKVGLVKYSIEELK